MRLGPEGMTLPDRQTAEMLHAYAWDNHAVLLEFPLVTTWQFHGQ